MESALDSIAEEVAREAVRAELRPFLESARARARDVIARVDDAVVAGELREAQGAIYLELYGLNRELEKMMEMASPSRDGVAAALEAALEAAKGGEGG